MAEFSGRGNTQEKGFSNKWSGAHITMKNAFGTLKDRFRCLRRAMDINTNTLPQNLFLCLALHH